MTNLYVEAMNSIEGYEATKDALNHIPRVRLEAAQKFPQKAEDLSAALVDDLIAGKDVDTTELGKESLEAAQAASEYQARLDVIDAAKVALQKRVDHYIMACRDDALRFLQARLSEVVKQVKAADKQLGDIATAEEAIDSGKSDAWKKASDAYRTYLAIRDAEKRINSQHVSPVGALDWADKRSKRRNAVGWTTDRQYWTPADGGSKDLAAVDVNGLREHADIVRVGTTEELANDYEALIAPPVDTGAVNVISFAADGGTPKKMSKEERTIRKGIEQGWNEPSASDICRAGREAARHF